MKIVVFGLSVSSAWGNGHATLWRGLCAALGRMGHCVVFFERDQPWYAAARDAATIDGADLVLYPDWTQVRARAALELRDADAAILTSYCPDATDARALMFDAERPLAVFYDLDTPVTLSGIEAGSPPAYVDELECFDLVLSYAGGPALQTLHSLGARAAHALYGHVDPAVHRPAAADARYAAALSWLGTYAADRQTALQALFIDAALRRPDLSFLIGGAQYPQDFPWTENIRFVHHVPPSQHAAFLCSSRLTLNVTREPMRRTGWCPSGRLFEAAACGAAILGDDWPGLSDFYEPGRDILVARDTGDALAALSLDDATLQRIGRAARERTLEEHTSTHRARRLVALLERAWSGATALQEEA